MKKYLLSSAVAAAIFAVCFAGNCLMSSPVSGQQPYPPAGAQSPGVSLPSVALVDVSYILKKHVCLHAAMKELNTEGEQVQKQFEEQLRALEERAKPLGTGGSDGVKYRPGSPEYNALEAQLVQEKSAIRTNIELKRKDFVQREAKLYSNAYKEICEEVRGYCERNSIALVLNFNGDAIHDDDPNNVAHSISKGVVYYNRQLDITGPILQRFVRPIVAETQNGYR